MTQKHSPTPMPPPYTSEGRAIRACDGRKSVTIARLVPGVLAIEHEEPTAQFIVRAVNAHDRMVEALEAIADVWNEYPGDTIAADDILNPHFGNIRDVINAAIRAAKGEA